MSDTARIRVRLDTNGARADLAQLYREMSNAPGVAVNGGGGGGGAAPRGPGGGFRSPIGLGGLVGLGAAAAIGRDSIGTAANLGGALTGGLSSKLNDILFGSTGSAATGGKAALEKMKGQLGLAVGLGADAGGFQAVFETIKGIETARAEGKRQLDLEFKPQIAADTAEGLLGRMLEVLEAILSAIPGDWF